MLHRTVRERSEKSAELWYKTLEQFEEIDDAVKERFNLEFAVRTSLRPDERFYSEEKVDDACARVLQQRAPQRHALHVLPRAPRPTRSTPAPGRRFTMETAIIPVTDDARVLYG